MTPTNEMFPPTDRRDSYYVYGQNYSQLGRGSSARVLPHDHMPSSVP